VRDVAVVLHVHEMAAAVARFAAGYTELLRTWPHHYVAVSDVVRVMLVTDCGVNPQVVTTIPACVSDEDQQRAVSLEGRGPEQEVGGAETIVVGGAGRPGWVKGLCLWLLMAVHLRQILGSKVRFRWVGVDDGRESREFAEMARKLKIDAWVELIPVTDHPFPIYATFNVLAVTSWEESASLVTLENMMLGVPVVCFGGSGGPAEILSDSGVVVEDFDPGAMASAIAELVYDSQRLKELTNAARNRISEHHSAPRAAKHLLTVLETAASRAGSKRGLR